MDAKAPESWFDPLKPRNEKRVQELFYDDLLPVLRKWGPVIGEKAMQGDHEAWAIIHRNRVLECWWDMGNYERLCRMLKNWLRKEELK